MHTPRKLARPQFIGRLRGRREKKALPAEPKTKETLDVISSLMGIAAKGALAFGLVTLIFYLGAAQHVVTGVNLTEGILLAALSLVLGVLGLGVLVMGTMQVFPHVNFVISAAASGASGRNLKGAQKASLYGFCASVAVYSFGFPLGIRRLLESGHDQIALCVLGLGALVAAALAVWWVRVHRMCLRTDASALAQLDSWGEGTNAGMFLFLSACLWLLLGFFLSTKILWVFAVIGCISAVGFSLLMSSGPRVKPGPD